MAREWTGIRTPVCWLARPQAHNRGAAVREMPKGSTSYETQTDYGNIEHRRMLRRRSASHQVSIRSPSIERKTVVVVCQSPSIADPEASADGCVTQVVNRIVDQVARKRIDGEGGTVAAVPGSLPLITGDGFETLSQP